MWVPCAKKRTRGYPYLALQRRASGFYIARMFKLHERQMTTSNSGAFFSFYFGGHVKKRKKKEENVEKENKKGLDLQLPGSFGSVGR